MELNDQLHVPDTYVPVKSPWYTMNCGWGEGVWASVEPDALDPSPLLLPGVELRFFGRPARSTVIIPSTAGLAVPN